MRRCRCRRCCSVNYGPAALFDGNAQGNTLGTASSTFATAGLGIRPYMQVGWWPGWGLAAAECSVMHACSARCKRCKQCAYRCSMISGVGCLCAHSLAVSPTGHMVPPAPLPGVVARETRRGAELC